MAFYEHAGGSFIASRYNFWSQSDTGQALLLNGATGALVEMDEAERQAALQILREPDIAEPDQLAELVAGGFLVPTSYDERELLLARADRSSDKSPLLELTISPTYQCNFRCTYCYVDFEPQRMSEDVATRVLAYVDRELPGYGHANITWFGGEPLLCADLVTTISQELVVIAAKHRVPLLLFLTTNGYLLSRSVAEDLLSAGIRHFHVTLDGTAPHHDTRRVLPGRRPTHDRILSNCLALLEADRRVRLTLRMNVDEENIASTVSLLEAFSPHIRSRVQVHVTPIISGDAHRPAQHLLRNINEVIHRALKMGFGFYDTSTDTHRPTFCAAAKRSSFQIGPDGRLHKCSPSGKTEVSVGVLTDLGTPLFNELHEAWQAASMLPDACLSCRYLCFCHGGCRLKRNLSIADCRVSMRFGWLAC